MTHFSLICRKTTSVFLTFVMTISSLLPNTIPVFQTPIAQAASLAETLPIVPTIDAAAKTRLRALLVNGQSRGNRPTVFAKIGDSITATGSFLVDAGCPTDPPNPFAGMGATIAYFSATTFSTSGAWCNASNSFTHDSRAAASGWRVDDLLGISTGDAPMRAGCNSGESQIACELRLSKPFAALIMIGTNNVDTIAGGATVASYKAQLSTLIDQTIAAGVIPVLSTIPPRLDQGGALEPQVTQINQAIIEVAQARTLPVWNYWRALQNIGAANHFGMDAEGIHPAAFRGGDASIVEGAALSSGYNVRNLTALQVLTKLKAIVIDNGPADGGSNSIVPESPTKTPIVTTPIDPIVPVVPPIVPVVPVRVPPVQNQQSSTPRTLRIYVAGESIEHRNRMTERPFTAIGSLNDPSNNDDDQYGWMIPLAERLKLRDTNLSIQFVGREPWTNAEDATYTGTYPSTTPGNTSAISGSSIEDWTNARRAELVARTYCYDVAFAARGGNDTSVDDATFKSQLKDLVRLLAHGSSCQTNPVVFVTGHMPDSQGTISALRPNFVDRVRATVTELENSDPGLRVRFIDMFSAFASNQITIAFPTPSWTNGTNSFDVGKIGRVGDGLHPRRLASIYAGEIAANAINLADLGGSSNTAPVTPTETNTTQVPPPASSTPPVSPVTTQAPSTSPVSTPTFTLSASPENISIVQGQTGTVTLALSRTNGFTGSVRFSYDRLPTNARASFTPSRTTGNTAVFTFSISRSVATGSYTVTARAVSGTITRTIVIPLNVVSVTAPAPNFTIARSPTTLSVQQGAEASVTVTLSRTNGFTGPVTISAAGLRTGVTAPTITIPTGSNSGVISFIGSGSASIGGPTTITLTAASGSLRKTTTVALTVLAAPATPPTSTRVPPTTSTQVPPTPPGPTPLPSPRVGAYSIGTPTLRDIWVDPVSGNDTNTGNTRAQALRNLTTAWNRVPQGTTLTGTGYRIMITPGTLATAAIPEYLEGRYGTHQFPVIIQAVDGRDTVTLTDDLNIYDTRYLYLIDFRIAPGHDPLHCEKCDHLLVRGMTIDGGASRPSHEGIKINQSQYVYIEDTDVSGADDNAIDFVAVQYGQVINSKIHNATDWCAYAKGGSAYLRYEGNEFYDCGTGGFVAGQGTGFEYMTSPWLHYEAYGITFVNNVIHDVNTSGLGVNGGYNILVAFNTLYRIGRGDHLIEFNFGTQGCDGDTTLQGGSRVLADNCSSYQTAGGWGDRTSGEQPVIPNKHVYIYNNVFFNPSGYVSPNMLQVPGTFARAPSAFNLPSTTRADEDLVIKNNIFWNGDSSTPLGIEGTSHCQSDNTSCNAAQLTRDNRFNVVQPQLISPASGNFRPIAGNNPLGITAIPLPTLRWNDLPTRPQAPAGYTSISVLTNRDGVSRSATNNVGAY